MLKTGTREAISTRKYAIASIDVGIVGNQNGAKKAVPLSLLMKSGQRFVQARSGVFCGDT